jgi:hypothetical protein
MTAPPPAPHADQPGKPAWWASWAVRSAARLLPAARRGRYRQEFLAELYGMSRPAQLCHAVGILSRAWALRVAVNQPARLIAKEAAVTRPWRCRLRIHRWQRLRNPDGGWYRECRLCHQQAEWQRVTLGTLSYFQ